MGKKRTELCCRSNIYLYTVYICFFSVGCIFLNFYSAVKQSRITKKIFVPDIYTSISSVFRSQVYLWAYDVLIIHLFSFCSASCMFCCNCSNSYISKDSSRSWGEVDGYGDDTSSKSKSRFLSPHTTQECEKIDEKPSVVLYCEHCFDHF